MRNLIYSRVVRVRRWSDEELAEVVAHYGRVRDAVAEGPASGPEEVSRIRQACAWEWTISRSTVSQSSLLTGQECENLISYISWILREFAVGMLPEQWRYPLKPNYRTTRQIVRVLSESGFPLGKPRCKEGRQLVSFLLDNEVGDSESPLDEDLGISDQALSMLEAGFDIDEIEERTALSCIAVWRLKAAWYLMLRESGLSDPEIARRGRDWEEDVERTIQEHSIHSYTTRWSGDDERDGHELWDISSYEEWPGTIASRYELRSAFRSGATWEEARDAAGVGSAEALRALASWLVDLRGSGFTAAEAASVATISRVKVAQVICVFGSSTEARCPNRTVGQVGSDIPESENRNHDLLGDSEAVTLGITGGSYVEMRPEGIDGSIDLLDLGFSPTNALRKGGIRMISELLRRREVDLLAIPGLGRKKLNSIMTGLDRNGLRLGDSQGRAAEVVANLHGAQQERSTGMSGVSLSDGRLLHVSRHCFEEGRPMPEVVESLGLDQQQVIRARTLWMVELLKGGQTLQEVGDKAGVSRERVRQLVKKAGVGSIRKLRSAEIAVRSEAEAMLRSSLHADIVAHPGTTVGGIASRLGLSSETVENLMIPSGRKLVRGIAGSSTFRQRWSDNQLLQLLRVAATYSWPLTTAAYDELVSIGEVDGPTAQVYFKRFESWIAACQLAGVESGEPWNRTYESNWSNDDLCKFVGDYLVDPATSGTIAEFGQWLRGVPGAPSIPTLRNRLGTWSEMRELALLRLAETWSDY
jgi:hypothetical protein